MPQESQLWLVTTALGLFLLVVLGGRYLAAALSRTALGPRIPLYLSTALSAWALAGLVVVAIWYIDQSSTTPDLELALAQTGLNTAVGFENGVIACAWMFLMAACVSGLVQIARQAAGGGPTDQALSLLPQSPAEVAVWTLVLAPTAGITEEFVYRGFLMGHAWAFLGNGWLAAILTSAIFGLVHGYQGAWGMLRTGLIGFVLALGVLATWSLIPSMMAHTLLNAFGVAFNPPVKRERPRPSRPASCASSR